MFNPGGSWGLAVVLGTVLLGVFIAYGMIVAPRRRATPDGTPHNERAGHRWALIGASVLFGLGLIWICWWLLVKTPGVAG